MKMKEEIERDGLKLSIQKAKIIAFGPITSWQLDEETVETVADFILGGSKVTADVTAKSLQSHSKVTATMKLKDACSLEENQ